MISKKTLIARYELVLVCLVRLQLKEKRSNNMKHRCGDCGKDHDINDLTINIGDEGHKVIHDIDTAVMGVVEKRRVPLELLIYAFAAYLEEIKQTGLQLGNKSDRIEMIIQVARNDVINEEGEKKEGEGSSFN
jgi:hypothetical protein